MSAPIALFASPARARDVNAFASDTVFRCWAKGRTSGSFDGWFLIFNALPLETKGDEAREGGEGDSGDEDFLEGVVVDDEEAGEGGGGDDGSELGGSSGDDGGNVYTR